MALSDYEQSIIDNVAEHGWFCVSVFGDEPHDTFAYSVGFGATLDAPECIIFSLPLKLMHSVLWSVFRKLQDGAQFAAGQRWPDLIEGFDCIARPVHPTQITREHFNSALWYWGDPAEHGESMQAFQFVWPGAQQGLFPWEPNCNEFVIRSQPALYLPREEGPA
jgi:hypothetical protein